MIETSVKFNSKNSPDFFRVLRKRVNNYFEENNISRTGNLNMRIKTIFMLVLYLAPLVIILIGLVTSKIGLIALWALMGIGMSGIGLSIMHDANHGSYSRNRRVNTWLGYLLNIIGGYHINWKIQHNILHHTYTNIDEYDEDIAKPVMRFSPNQIWRPVYRFQLYYAPVLYALMTIYWVISKDIEQIYRYKKRDLLKSQRISYGEALLTVIANKLVYVSLLVILPMLIVPQPWWFILLGFLLMHIICGLVLALIFQPAHVVNETDFFKADDNACVENNWAIHQLHTTSNYANNSTVFSWFIGGLNHQIEHHLFPKVCHVHYKKLSPIVKQTAKEFNLPYHEHRTFAGALLSHFQLLNDLGTRRYDRRMAMEQSI